MLSIAVYLGFVLSPLLVASVSGTENGSGGAKQGRNSAKITFAGGCFWSIEAPFEKMGGVSFAAGVRDGGPPPTRAGPPRPRGKSDPLLDTIALVDPGFPSFRNIDMNLDFRWLPRHAPRSS